MKQPPRYIADNLAARLTPRRIKDVLKRLAAVATSGRYRSLVKEHPLVDGYERVYHYHIRKTAGMSVNHAFRGLGGEDPQVVSDRCRTNMFGRTVSGGRVFVAWNRPLIEQGYYHYASSHLPYDQLALRPGTFTLTCLRDPADRVYSHWKMLRRCLDSNLTMPALHVEAAWMGDSFAEFLDRAPRAHVLNQLCMFSANFNVDEALERLGGLNGILFVNTLAQDLAALGQRMGLELPVLQVNRSPGPNISAADAARLREILAPEYDMLARVRKILGQR